MAEVQLEQVGKTFARGVRAVHDVTFRAADGEFVVLVGPSGCGKTTTLRLIAGLETPTTGTIRIEGRVVTREPPHRRDVAMVFQRPALYPHLNVRENLAFGLDVRRRVGPAERRERIERTARLLELSDLLDRRPYELSGGQQQRAALGRALVREPAVFLLDEPLSNLDARLRMEMRRELHLLHRRLRATILYVTHDQEEALTLGDRVVVLDRGEVQQVGSPQEVYDRPANRMVAGFLGWPPMNLLPGRLVESEGRLRLEAEQGGWPLEGRPDWRPFRGREVVLGVRPEHVRLTAPEKAVGKDDRLVECPGATAPGGVTGQAPPIMEVRLVERLGPLRLATADGGGWTVTARLDGPTPVREGDAVGVEIALVQAHLFDRRSGAALCHGRAEGEPMTCPPG